MSPSGCGDRCFHEKLISNNTIAQYITACKECGVMFMCQVFKDVHDKMEADKKTGYQRDLHYNPIKDNEWETHCPTHRIKHQKKRAALIWAKDNPDKVVLCQAKDKKAKEIIK